MIIKKIITKFFELLLPFVDKMAHLNYNYNPFLNNPISDIQTYQNLAKIAEKNTYSVDDVKALEVSGYQIDRDWLNSLALKTQIVIKKSKLNYAHGRVLYSVLRKYIDQKKILNL